MNELFIRWLKSNRVVLSSDQKVLADGIFKILDNYPELLTCEAGKTFLFRKIEEFLDTRLQPHQRAETIRPR